MHVYIIHWRVVHRQYMCNCLLSTHNLLVRWNKCPIGSRDDGYRQRRVLGCVRNHMCLTCSWHVHTSMTKITTPSENCSTWHTLSPIHILNSTVNVGSTNTFCRQKLDYCALSLFGGILGTIVNCYLASVSVNNTLPLSSVYQNLLTYTAIYREIAKFYRLE